MLSKNPQLLQSYRTSNVFLSRHICLDPDGPTLSNAIWLFVQTQMIIHQILLRNNRHFLWVDCSSNNVFVSTCMEDGRLPSLFPWRKTLQQCFSNRGPVKNFQGFCERLGLKKQQTHIFFELCTLYSASTLGDGKVYRS